MIFTPFQTTGMPVLMGQYPQGPQEQHGGSMPVYTGSGTITAVSANYGRFRLYDSTSGGFGNPIFSADSTSFLNLTALSIAFSNGLYIIADGKNSGITITASVPH